MNNRFSGLLIAPLILVTAPQLEAAVGYDAEYRADYTDNLFQVDEGSDEKTEELTHNYRLGLFGNFSGSRAKTDFIANIEYKDHQDDNYDDEAQTSFIGASEIALTPRVFSWYIADALGYADTDTSLVDNTRDADRVNYFITGPQARFQIGGDKNAGTSLYYTHHDREGEVDDYQRGTFNGFFENTISSRSLWGMEVDHTEMLFDDASSRIDYSHSELKAKYEYKTKADSFSIEAGGSLLNTDVEGADADTTGTADVIWDHLFTRRAGVILRAGYGLSDESVLSNTQLSDTGNFETDDENGLFYETSAGVTYYYKGVSTRVDFGIDGRSLDYIEEAQNETDLANDHDIYSVFTRFSRRFGQAVDMNLGLSAEQKEYKDIDFEEQLYIASLEGVYQFNRNLNLKAKAEYQSGEGNRFLDDNSIADRESEEYIYSIGLHWDPMKSRRNDDRLKFFDLSIIN